MDLGVVGLDNVGLVCSDTNSFNISAAAADAAASESINISKNQEKWYGSGFLKQGRSVNAPEDDLRGLKVAKFAALDDLSSSKAMHRASLLSSFTTPTASAAATANNNNNNITNNNFFSDGQQMMLSFSSPNTQTATLPFCYPSSNAYARNAGKMQGVLPGVKGPFTPSQWMELEHQALIYKYIDANAPIPCHLLTPIRKVLDSAGFSSFMGLRPVTYGWGGFHLGFSSSTDPEPGRCRRTDGKKWRCSRDAVADHKYCERHMNRGRHRSRKPVEGQSGHSLSGTKDISVKQPNVSSTPAAVVPGGGASNSLGLPTHQQLNSHSFAASQTSVSAQVNRNYLDKENSDEKCQDFTGLSTISSLSLKGHHYSIPKQSAGEEFGQVSYGSLLNPLNKSSSLNCSNYATSQDLNQNKNKSDNGLRQLFVDWPNNQSEETWPEMDLCSDRTQLSISIPMAAADFMSSTSSPTNEKGISSPLRLSRDLEATHMGLGMGTYADDHSRKGANWVPISWESSMGGPLGEVLHSTNSNSAEGKIPSALNLMTDGWDGSLQVATSPTGVLHKSTFVSLSNSSAGSSPRIESNRGNEGASLCSTALGSTLINPA